MPDRVEFRYRLTGNGWSERTISVGDVGVTVTASYLSDALGDLLRALRALTEGAGEAKTWWEEEPGEYRWLLVRSGGVVRVRVLEFPDVVDQSADHEGGVLLDAECRLVDLVRAAAASARELLEEHGEDGYRARWIEHAFPSEDLAALERWVVEDRS